MATRIISAIVIALLAVIAVMAIQAQHHSAPVCIVVHSNGAPAPASCTNPDSYQVSDGS